MHVPPESKMPPPELKLTAPVGPAPAVTEPTTDTEHVAGWAMPTASGEHDTETDVATGKRSAVTPHGPLAPGMKFC